MTLKSHEKTKIKKVLDILHHNYPTLDIYTWEDMGEVEFWSTHNLGAIRYDINDKAWHSSMLKDIWVTSFCELLPRPKAA